ISNEEEKQCFLCGKEVMNSTKEHIFPKWLLKKYDLYNQKVKILVNDTTIPYRNLTIPCCHKCNGEYLSIVEDKMKKITEENSDQLQKEEEEIIFLWGAKIFYGLLYKELELAYDRSNPESNTIMNKEFLENYNILHHLLQGIIIPTKYEGKPWSIFKFNICEDGNIQQNEYSEYFSEIKKYIIHPIQFRELIAKINYKETLRIKKPKFITISQERQRTILITKPSGNIYNQWN